MYSTIYFVVGLFIIYGNIATFPEMIFIKFTLFPIVKKDFCNAEN